MASIMTKRGSQDNVITYEHICDNTSDMASIEDKYATLGSTCIVLKGESGGMEVYIADSGHQWQSLAIAGASGGSGSTIVVDNSSLFHVCTKSEIRVNGTPKITSPEENTIYLVPTDGETNNLFNEYLYVNGKWEMIGSAGMDLSEYATHTEVDNLYTYVSNNYLEQSKASNTYATKNALSDYAPKESPIFTGSISLNRKADTTIGTNSIAIGKQATASGQYSCAQGEQTKALAQAAHAEGQLTEASGPYSHAEGKWTKTSSGAWFSHAEGLYTYTGSDAAHAEGEGDSNFSITINNRNYSQAGAYGRASHSEGKSTLAIGDNAHAEGSNTVANGFSSHAEGQGSSTTKVIEGITYSNSGAWGYSAHSEGERGYAIGPASHSEGIDTIAAGTASHAEGTNTTAIGDYSCVQGYSTIATGSCMNVSGSYNVDNGPEYTIWNNTTSYAHGDLVKYSNNLYRCLRENTGYAPDTAPGYWQPQSFDQVKGLYVEIIGNGISDASRSNARALDWNGNERLNGNLYINCNTDSTGGEKVATEAYVNTRIPTPPTTDGTYTLQVTVTNGTPTYSWV